MIIFIIKYFLSQRDGLIKNLVPHKRKIIWSPDKSGPIGGSIRIEK